MNTTPGQDQKDIAADAGPAPWAVLSSTKVIREAMHRALATTEAIASRHIHTLLSGTPGDGTTLEDATASAVIPESDMAPRPDHDAWIGPLLRMLDDQSPELRVTAFYLPPWEAWLHEAAQAGTTESGGDEGASAGTEWLDQWREYHERLLEMRSARPTRVTLINAGRLDAGSLAAMLAAAGHGSLHDLRIQAAIASIPPIVGPLARLLSAGIAEEAPECWETYEQLESCALIHGREPEFRANAASGDGDELPTLLALARDIQASVADDAGPGGRGNPAGALLDELREENELLALQVEQLHEELEFQVKAGSQMHAMLQEAGGTAEAARRLITRLADR